MKKYVVTLLNALGVFAALLLLWQILVLLLHLPAYMLPAPLGVGRAVVVVVLATVGFGGIGLLLAGMLRPEVNLAAANGLWLLLLLVSGMLAPLSKLPGWLEEVSKLLPAVVRCTRAGGHLVALVKPQFEVGREQASRGKGVVRDEAVRADAIDAVTRDIADAGFEVIGRCDSVLSGPRGNREAFVHARLGRRT